MCWKDGHVDGGVGGEGAGGELKGCALMLAALTAVSAQRTPSDPKFEDYPTREIFDRTAHAPLLVTPEQRKFRTRIRDGVSKGWGARIDGVSGEEQSKPAPNFAGHYVVVFWGCGTGCVQMATIDAKTGVVYDPPISGGGFRLPMLTFPMSVGGGRT